MQAAHPADQVGVAEPQRSAVLAELHRILTSQCFRGSRRCCRFLEYSVHHVLDGASQELRERNIGIEVFQRPPDYDTAEDAIVRVTANEVRKRLAQFYQDMADEPDPVISLPPGSYAVTLRWRATEPPQKLPAPAPQLPDSRFLTMNLVWAAVAIVAVLVIATIYVWGYGSSESHRTQARAADDDPVWPALFHSGQKINIVMADAARYEIQEMLVRDISLKDYLDTKYPMNLLGMAAPELQRVVRFMGGRETTSVASTSTGSRLQEAARRHGLSFFLRHPRHLNVREFKTDSFILLGSRLSIPWVELFEPSLNFNMKIDPVTWKFYLSNRAPRPGEPARYQNSRKEDETWVDVAVLPNRDRTGTIVIFNAIDMMGIEAAGEFFLNGSLAQTLASTGVTATAGTRDRSIEILLRVHSIGGSVSKSDVVSVRQGSLNGQGTEGEEAQRYGVD
jgi:hypothetical protein